MRNEIVKSNVPGFKMRAWDEVKSEGGHLSGMHFHDELELLPIFEGEFHCQVGNTDYCAVAGDLLFINARVPHATHARGYTSHGMLQFRERDFHDKELFRLIKYSVRLKDIEGEPVKIIRSPELTRAVMQVLEETVRRDVAYDCFVRSGILSILGHLYRSGILPDANAVYSSKEIRKILPVLSYVNEHYNEEITLCEISSVCGFDPSYFCRLFKRATGATFTEYLNFVRVCKAETMLARTELGILEISEAVGFSSASYFNKVFKRFLGTSPKVYREASYVAISSSDGE